MLQILAIAGGGALGALGHFWVSSGVYCLLGRDLPWGTLVVNVLGSFLMGLLFVLFNERSITGPEVKSAVLIGFLGAFTTLEEHRKARERKRRAECDAPPRRRRAEPFVGVRRVSAAETKGPAMRHGVQSLWESWCRAECAPGRTQDERGPPKAMAVASFCAPDIGRTPFRVSRTMATLRVHLLRGDPGLDRSGLSGPSLSQYGDEPAGLSLACWTGFLLGRSL